MSAPPPVSYFTLAQQARNWPTLLALIPLFILAWCPHPVQRGVAHSLAALLFSVAKRRRRIARINIDLAFPELSADERKQLLRAHFNAMTLSLFELATSWWRDLSFLDSRVDIIGAENLVAALEKGGVVLFSGHFSSWEICGLYLGRRHTLTASFRPHENPVINALLNRTRGHYFPKLYERSDIRGMIRELRNGGVLWYASDQNFGHKGSAFVDFFGVPAATNTALSRIARIGKASVVPYFPLRRPGGRYELRIGPALEGFPSDDPVIDARRANALIEQAVRLAPEQYFWTHRRYKDRPGDEKRFY